MIEDWERSKAANTELLTMLLLDKPAVTLDALLQASLNHARLVNRMKIELINRDKAIQAGKK